MRGKRDGALFQTAHPEPVEGSVAVIEKTLRQAQGERNGERRSIRFAGYAAIFDRVDRGGDVIRPGAFARSLAAGRAVPLLRQHERGRVIGRIERIEEDARGLRVIGRVEDAGARAPLAQGSGLSFGYRVRRGRRTATGRELRELELIEVSLVGVPMQPLARVHAVKPLKSFQ